MGKSASDLYLLLTGTLLSAKKPIGFAGNNPPENG